MDTTASWVAWFDVGPETKAAQAKGCCPYTLNEKFARSQGKFAWALFVIGFVNSYGFRVASAGAAELSKQFNKSELMPLIQLSLFGTNAFVRVLISRYMLRVSHWRRHIWFTFAALFAPAIIAFCLVYSKFEGLFWVSIIGILLIGMASTLGESTNLGFLKGFPGEGLAYYASSNAFAGILGTLSFLLWRPTGVPESLIYMFMVPLSIPTLLLFMWLVIQKQNYPFKVPEGEQPYHEVRQTFRLDKMGPCEYKKLKEEGIADNICLTWANIKQILRKEGAPIVQMGLVFFMSNVVIVTYTVVSISQIGEEFPEMKTDFVLKNAFVLFMLMVSSGTFLGRTSLLCVRIERIWTITVIQTAFFVFFITNEMSFIVKDIYILLLIVYIMGLNMGVIYISVINRMKVSQVLLKTEKELAINVAVLTRDAGSLLAMLVSLILSVTVFVKYTADQD